MTSPSSSCGLAAEVRLLITGATGWVGSVVVRELLARGHQALCVVRGAQGRSRLHALVGPGSAWLSTIDGDVTLPLAGVALDDLPDGVDAVLHLAALVRLDAVAETELIRVNVDGTSNTLALAERLGASTFLHVSTCSVAGDAASFHENDLEVGQRFRNGYERTKLEAEKRAATWGGRLVIARVPGVIGDSRTGASDFFSGAFYETLAAYTLLRDDLADEWRADRAALEAEHIRFDDAGTLHLPLHVAFNPALDCPIVCQDWLAHTIVDLVEHRDARGTFQLVHSQPPTLGYVLRTALALASIDSHPSATTTSGPWSRYLRRVLERGTRHHAAYLQAVPRLSNERLPQVFGARYRPPPALDEGLLGRVIAFATAARFGA